MAKRAAIVGNTEHSDRAPLAAAIRAEGLSESVERYDLSAMSAEPLMQ